MKEDLTFSSPQVVDRDIFEPHGGSFNERPPGPIDRAPSTDSA
jgi:hypothetical protein